MTPTNEQIFAEAIRRQKERGGGAVTDFIIEVVREGWTPPKPEPVDPDILAFREWAAARLPVNAEAIHKGLYDEESAGFLAGARMAREQERERAKVLVEYVEKLKNGFFLYATYRELAAQALAKYQGEA